MKKSKKETDNEKSSVGSKFNIFKDLKEETVEGVLAIIFIVVAIFLLISAFGKGGFAGEKIFLFLSYLLGIGYYLIPASLIMLGVSFLRSLENNFATPKIFGSILFFFSGLGIIDTLFKGEGGVIGQFISTPMIKLFEVYASLIILSAVLLISLLVIFDTKLSFSFIWKLIQKLFKRGDNLKVSKPEVEEEEVVAEEEEEVEIPEKKDKKPEEKVKAALIAKKEEEDFILPSKKRMILGKFVPPPLSLLELDRGKPGVGDIKANANVIKRTLQNFGIDVEMDEISIGPSVTRYALKPAEGVKLSRIVGLQNDLALALAAHPIRIEAPIPGKSLVGIEIPNSTKTTVGLGSLLGTNEFQHSEKPLLIALGKGVSGRSHFGNLGKMPHLLIAGATGSGKSVTIHSIITSLLYRNSPSNLKFIMIDPKRVELTLYNKIPHLLTPVITEAKKTILALRWAAKEMDRRYDILEAESVRDIESYHKNILEPELKKIEARQKTMKDGDLEDKMPETMPYIVIVIDELADIMQAYPRELESAIVRLAQMSRAVGIHLMVSTQRPSVNVITGLIKANIPARVALQVASQVDSRTILDSSGAEKLLGSGDMLYISGEMSKPVRLQSPYISEKELKSVVKHIIDSYQDEIPNEINITGENEKNLTFEAMGDLNGGLTASGNDSGSLDDDDELYEQAKEIVISAGKASTSYIQRKLRVGYARAARLIDMLEERGVIGPGDGAKAREVIGVDTNVAQNLNTEDAEEPVEDEEEKGPERLNTL